MNLAPQLRFLAGLFWPAAAKPSATDSLQRLKKAESLPIRILSVGFSVLVWFYLVLLISAWMLIYFAGDRWWLATVMLFGPRWIYGLPLAAFVPVAAIWRRRSLFLLMLAAAIVVGPIMGLCFGLARFAPTARQLRLLTCNVDGKNVKAEALRALVLQSNPNVIRCRSSTTARNGCWVCCRQGSMPYATAN